MSNPATSLRESSAIQYNLNPFEKRFVGLLEESLGALTPSGREEEMADFVRGQLDEMGYAHTTDPAGNVIVRLEGQDANAPLSILGAHLDEIGLVVTYIEPDGTLRVDRSGGTVAEKLGERPVVVFGDHGTINAVISMGAGRGVSPGTDPEWVAVRLITGLSPAQLAERGIRVGSTAVVSREGGRGPLIFGDPANPLIGAWTFDDRGGILVQLLLLERLRKEGAKPLHPTLVAFTIQEEQGCHGAKNLTHRERPDLFIAVDGCPWRPESGVEVSECPVAWSKDKLAHYDQRILAILGCCAREEGTRLQTTVINTSNSDASHVFSVGGAPRVAIIGHSRYNSHGFEVARLSVFENVTKTLFRFLTQAIW